MSIRSAIKYALIVFSAFSEGAYAFYCTSSGEVIKGGVTDVYVNLDPTVEIGQNIVVNLGNSITCKNEAPEVYLDPIRLISGQFTGPLDNLLGSIKYYGTPYEFPINNPTKTVNHTWGAPRPWEATLYLKVIGSGAAGVAVNAGQMLATLTMEKVVSIPYQVLTWHIYANNSVVVPTGGCDVSARNITINLPDYPGRAAVPLTVHCAENQNVFYYLTGTTVDSARTVFANTSSVSPAVGLGVQISNSSGIISANKSMQLGLVGNGEISLGLSASYGNTGAQVVAGNVQSIIGLTFVYD